MGKFFGNDAAMQQLGMYYDSAQSQWTPIFIIAVWPHWIWKTSFLRSFAEEKLWLYSKTDFLWIRDCSKYLWKQHILPVEMPKTSARMIDIVDEWIVYENKWVREINDWLQYSSIWGKKIVLIENMERMNGSSMNAFLKTCEEPLKWRYIFATLDHVSSVLPTIISRAMVIKFFPLSDSEMEEYLKNNEIVFPDNHKDIIIKLAMWKPWILKTLSSIFWENSDLFDKIRELFWLMQNKGNLNKKLNLFKEVQDCWLYDVFLDALIKDYVEQWRSELADEWIKVKKMPLNNVSIDNALWYWILALEG